MTGQGSGKILTEGNSDLPLLRGTEGAFRLRGGNGLGRVFLIELFWEASVALRRRDHPRTRRLRDRRS